jgi:predicted nucleic acid-binding protein
LTGVAVHDARLVAVMLARGIGSIVTLNERDFRRYSGIAVLPPDKV